MQGSCGLEVECLISQKVPCPHPSDRSRFNPFRTAPPKRRKTRSLWSLYLPRIPCAHTRFSFLSSSSFSLITSRSLHTLTSVVHSFITTRIHQSQGFKLHFHFTTNDNNKLTFISSRYPNNQPKCSSPSPPPLRSSQPLPWPASPPTPLLRSP